jgi:lantibiotic biosynthesis protein
VEVRPCSGHMLNASRAPAIIRFLSDLCLDGVHKLSQFQWGPCTRFPFLPRLQVGRVVFSLAQWSLSSSFHVDELCLESSAQFQKTLARWRERWQVPRYVYLAERDNRLLLDLEQFNQAEEFRSTLQTRKDTQTVILQEALPGPEHAWLEGPGGHYLSEYIVSLIQRPSMTPAEPAITTSYASTGEQQMVVNAERLKGPGSEWLFLKLYCASTLQDELITGPLRTLLQEVFAQKLAEGWFFIRYVDPDPHIRLRFRGNPHLLTSQLFPRLCTWATKLVSDGPCRKFVFDSYEREIERYGGLEGIALAEKLFEADSRAVMELLQLKRTGKLTLDSQMLAVLTTDDLLAGLGLSPQERLQWYSQHVSTTREAGAIYRQKSVELRALLHDAQHIQKLQGGKRLMEVLDARRVCLSQVGQELVGLATRRGLKPTQIYASFTHMHSNRLLGRDRKEERSVLELARRTWMGLELDRRKTALPEA